MALPYSASPAPAVTDSRAQRIVGVDECDGQSTSGIYKKTQANIDTLKRRTCRECGAHFQAQRVSREFCCTKCRQIFHNRAASRAAEIFHVLMAMRFDRANAKAAGAWSLLCRMAAAFKAEDDRARPGRRPSWDGIEKVKARNAHLLATVVADNLAGQRRRPKRNLGASK
jgi:endogenous inhibitor of DNA gyrase (YacG/DUF329 family)